MTMGELKWLIDESGFICDLSKQEAVQERGSCQLSIDVIDSKYPHSYRNSRVTQSQLNTCHSYTNEVYNNMFKDYEELNHHHYDSDSLQRIGMN